MRKVLAPIILSALLISILLVLSQCEKPEKIVKVSTLDVVAEDISYTTVTLRGEIIDAGDNGADDHGVLLSEFATLDMSISDQKSLGAKGNTGIFEATYDNLNENTVYYFRAFATSGEKDILAGVKQFKTLETGTPQLSTLSISENIAGAIKMSYEIISDGGEEIENTGIVWSFDPDPSITIFLDSIMFNKTHTSFDTTLYGLKCDTTIYFKVFAGNTKGTKYGPEASFTTLRCPGKPELITTAVTNITETTASSGGTIIFDGHSEIIDKGICWSLNPNPTIVDSINSAGGGSDQFSASLSGLYRNGNYYVRAYATNMYGTSYGDELTFTTINNLITGTFTDDRDGNLYEWVEIGGQIWMSENLRYLPSVSPPNVLSSTLPVYYVYDYQGSDTSEAKSNQNYITYGTLYNWPATVNGTVGSSENPSGLQGACPIGWHVPSDTEWEELEDFLGGENIAGGKLKEIETSHWASPNTGATNESGFEALPGGERDRNLGGSFTGIGTSATFWHATSMRRILGNSRESLVKLAVNSEYGFSVRCVQDKIPTVLTKLISSVTSSFSIVHGEVLDDGRGSVSEYGVCWNTLGTPTTTDNKKTEGSGLGSFYSELSGLTSSTTYYIRAFAINEFGTSYGKELSFTTLGGTSGTITDAINGDDYPWVEIGNQIWMAENLKATKFNDGSDIPNITDLTQWRSLTTSAYAWYNNDDATNKDTYGALYNWYTADTKKLCPEGWHIPSDQEWQKMIDFLGGWNVAGGKLKVPGTTYWRSTNVGATNSTGFNGRGAGMVNSNTGYESFAGIRESAYYWSVEGNWRQLFFAGAYFEFLSSVKKYHGVSVRCIKD